MGAAHEVDRSQINQLLKEEKLLEAVRLLRQCQYCGGDLTESDKKLIKKADIIEYVRRV
jgi:transcription initiation factor IIE alpha subunit